MPKFPLSLIYIFFNQQQGELRMNKSGAIFIVVSLIFSSFFPALCGHPVEPLSDIIGASPYIFTGSVVSTKKTDKSIMQGYVNFYYYVITIKIDTVIKGDKKLKTFDVMDFPGSPGCIDTTHNLKHLYFLSKSSVATKDVTDWMVEREYKIEAGIISPTEIQDESFNQPLKPFLKKIGKIVKEQTIKK
jgi:hypothetical protein